MTFHGTKHENRATAEQNTDLRHVLNWYCNHINKRERGQEGDPANMAGYDQDDVD